MATTRRRTPFTGHITPRLTLIGLVILLLTAFSGVASDDDNSPADWTRIDDGLYHAVFTAQPPSDIGDSRIDILRIDPRRYRLVVKMTSQTGEKEMTAPEWSQKFDLIAVTNAGMFQEDYRTHVGYLRHDGHVNSRGNVRKYLSAAAFDPVDTTQPPFRMFDLDSLPLDSVKQNYRTVIQNLRLIKRPGVNVWSQQDRKWSEAALGEDKDGNILFIFSRSPYSMYDLNTILLHLPIGLVAAQHLEGGPEASLYLSYKDTKIERVGSFETSFMPGNGNLRFWPVPNVIGISKR